MPLQLYQIQRHSCTTAGAAVLLSERRTWSYHWCPLLPDVSTPLKKNMSYYPPHTGTGYPYSSYPNYPQTPGTYPTTPYSTYPATGVTGYGAAWPYQAYSYYAHPQQQQQQQQQQQSAASTAAKPVATTSTFPSTPTVTTPATTAPPRPAPAQYTFAQTYTPSATGLTATRSSKKQPTFKGLFAKERMCIPCRTLCSPG